MTDRRAISLLALTVWQPWATLIVEGAKPYEFRPWRPIERLVGERIAIHAGARRMRLDEIRALLIKLHRPHAGGTALIPGQAQPILERLRRIPASHVPHASVLGTAMLGPPKLATELFGPELDGKPVDPEMWAWPMLHIERFDIPVPARGYQGFWRWQRGTEQAA
jgi:hypothetical protein